MQQIFNIFIQFFDVLIFKCKNIQYKFQKAYKPQFKNFEKRAILKKLIKKSPQYIIFLYAYETIFETSFFIQPATQVEDMQSQ